MAIQLSCPELMDRRNWLISIEMSARVYECVRSCPYTVSSECHLMKRGLSVDWRRSHPRSRPAISPGWRSVRNQRGWRDAPSKPFNSRFFVFARTTASGFDNCSSVTARVAGRQHHGQGYRAVTWTGSIWSQPSPSVQSISDIDKDLGGPAD